MCQQGRQNLNRAVMLKHSLDEFPTGLLQRYNLLFNKGFVKTHTVYESA